MSVTKADMKLEDLPPRWRSKVLEWLQSNSHHRLDRFSAGDFPGSHSLELTFEDESTAVFNYAIAIEAPELRELGIFTEHCGYHIFPLGGTCIRKVETE